MPLTGREVGGSPAPVKPGAQLAVGEPGERVVELPAGVPELAVNSAATAIKFLSEWLP